MMANCTYRVLIIENIVYKTFTSPTTYLKYSLQYCESGSKNLKRPTKIKAIRERI